MRITKEKEESKDLIEQCRFYTTTGHPSFAPSCVVGFRASLQCHGKRKDCPGYIPSEVRE